MRNITESLTPASADDVERSDVRRSGARPPTVALVCLAILGAMVIAAVGAALLAPYDPNQHDLGSRLVPPIWMDGGTAEHLLGTDNFGRDILSRLIYGARLSLGVAGLSLLFGGVAGGITGVLSGYIGGRFDVVVMRLVDAMLALPTILVAIALAVALGPSFRNVVIVLAILVWPKIVRQVRGEALGIKEENFVRYARATGVPHLWIMAQHVLPNVVPTLLVVSTLEVGQVILVESYLSFVGAGIPPPDPSWGGIVSEGRAFMATGWWMAVFPGIAIVLTVLSLNTVGDWLRDTLDPRLKRR